ncbi:MAG TPA: type I restriction enzyme HsdR N-terminal domain-containing protein [Verrucomicrobiae bacterium]|jgi:hypothetical protein|nr:type I restriction enzyme HsdR N-terminal domain-containing protein [Verrucomicrobiae bacterium]
MKINIIHDLRKYLPFLLKAKSDNLNEADTSQRVSKVLESVLGYDPMTEISREVEIRSKYVDLAVKLDGVVKFYVEIKSAGTPLKDRHIEQCERYAAETNLHWVLLTNGVDWNLYHLTFDEGIEYDLAFSVTLADELLAKDSELLGLLHKTSIKTGELEAFWEHWTALSPASIGKALFTEDTMLLMRREIRRKHGLLIGVEDIAAAIHSMFTPEAKELVGPPKIRIKKTTKGANGKASQVIGANEANNPPIIGGI